jgi:UDP-N-acetyl-D-glucosamine dehydrogenase
MNIVPKALSDIGRVVGELGPAARLRQRIETGTARVGVIGLGYVGLPLVPAIVHGGLDVIGFDTDVRKICDLKEGRSYIRHIPDNTIAELVDGGHFAPTSDMSRIAEADAVLICVPTPLTRNREPDLSYVVATSEAIAPHLRSGQLISLESTTYPGTTRDVLRPILERGGLRSGVDFFLVYSPEREDPGNPQFATSQIPKVVGGDGEVALELGRQLYSRVVSQTVPVSSVETAEAVKLTENIFRAVNIALVNELKLLYEHLGIDIWEVVEAAKTKPFGYMPFYPGPGLGGHCLPIDPFYLSWKAREHGIVTRFIELAGEINTSMPGHVVNKVATAVDTHTGRGLKAARILVLGVAYKKDVDDIRESPALRIIELLEERGAIVDYYDPFVPVIPDTREHSDLAGRTSVSLEPEVLTGYSAVLVCTDHSNVDYDLVMAHASVIVDTRNTCAYHPGQAAHLVRA